MDGQIGVAEVIRQLRGDLYLAAWQGEDKDPKFELGPIELEFAVVVDSKLSVDAAARLWVVDIGAKSSMSSNATHRIKIILNPTDRSGNKTYVSGARIDGEEVPANGSAE